MQDTVHEDGIPDGQEDEEDVGHEGEGQYPPRQGGGEDTSPDYEHEDVDRPQGCCPRYPAPLLA
jgi:hypothetical protein